MVKFLFVGLLFLCFSSAFAANKKFEYQTVDYTVKDEFVKKMNDLGTQGWELVSCLTTGASNYSAPISGGGIVSGLLLARTSYCIFKREIF